MEHLFNWSIHIGLADFMCTLSIESNGECETVTSIEVSQVSPNNDALCSEEGQQVRCEGIDR